MSGLLVAMIIPMFRLAHLPLRVDLAEMAGAYWYGVSFRAIFVATGLVLIGLPWSQSGSPTLKRYGQQKMRLPFLFLFSLLMIYIFGLSLGLMVTVDGIAIAELFDRDPSQFGNRAFDVLLVATYFFVGLVLVFSMNHAIAEMKFAGGWDDWFNSMDSGLFGITVSQFANWSKTHVPQAIWHVAAIAYYGVYGQVGAILIIVVLRHYRTQGTRFAGTILTAYALALILFYCVPTMGPFALRDGPLHTGDYLDGTRFTQKVLPVRARLLAQHAPIPELMRASVSDYYIGFPSMHIAMPVIGLWFVRRWRKLTIALLVWDVFLVLGIVLLEWHYFLDIVGGVAVALLAIYINCKTVE